MGSWLCGRISLKHESPFHEIHYSVSDPSLGLVNRSCVKCFPKSRQKDSRLSKVIINVDPTVSFDELSTFAFPLAQSTILIPSLYSAPLRSFPSVLSRNS